MQIDPRSQEYYDNDVDVFVSFRFLDGRGPAEELKEALEHVGSAFPRRVSEKSSL
jgi:hypothetical protein